MRAAVTLDWLEPARDSRTSQRPSGPGRIRQNQPELVRAHRSSLEIVNTCRNLPDTVRADQGPSYCAQQTDMHIRYESTAYSVGNVYEEKEYLYISDVRSVLLATSYLVSLATFRCFTADHPARPVNDVQLVTSC
jgi:hypothetical protein